MTDIEIASLGSLTSIGEGGEGEVFLCSSRPNEVFKRFKNTVADEISEQGMIETVRLLGVMDPVDRARVASRAMWPTALVREHGRMLGFMMPELPDTVKCRHGRKEAMKDGLIDWNKLTLRHTWMSNPILGSTVPKITDSKDDHRRLVLLLRDLAETFAVLHKYRIVVGDVSGRNILWHLSPEPTAMLIDCDGFRLEGSRAVTEPKQSPDWRDPHLVGDTSIESDLYKLGLAIYRAYYSDGLGYPNNGERRSNSKKSAVSDAAKRSLAGSDRPSAQEWVDVLSGVLDDRRRVPWLAVRRRTGSPVSMAGPRPTVTLAQVASAGDPSPVDRSHASDSNDRQVVDDSRPTTKFKRRT